MSGTNETLTAVIPASGALTFPRGRIFYIITAAHNVTVTLDAAGGKVQAGVRKFANIPAGSYFKAPIGEEWTYLRLTGTVGDSIQLYVGDDEMTFAQAVSVIGSVSTTPVAYSLTDHADVSVANASTDSTIVAAGARKRITIGALSTNTGSLRIRASGAVVGGIELQPGMQYTLSTAAALDIRNDSGAAQTYYWQEYF